MKLVVDTNILFSFFWKNSVTRDLITSSGFELISPEIALKELEKYSREISSKLRITKKEFDKEMQELKKIISFTKKREYNNLIKYAEEISPDKNDAEFFALCLKFSCFLWSNDSILKNQNKIKVLSTSEIIESMF